MVKKLAIVVLVFVSLVAGIGLLLPRAWHVERAVVIDAPPERILPFVASLKRWQDWSVWTRSFDPKASHTYVGPESGPGARWQWSGPTIGHGAMTVTAADVTGVSLDEAIESDSVNARARLAFTPLDAQRTRVTWTDDGTLPPMGGFFRDLVEASLGGHFETGLATLKRVVEAQPPPVQLPPPSSLEPLLAPDAG